MISVTLVGLETRHSESSLSLFLTFHFNLHFQIRLLISMKKLWAFN